MFPYFPVCDIRNLDGGHEEFGGDCLKSPPTGPQCANLADCLNGKFRHPAINSAWDSMAMFVLFVLNIVSVSAKPEMLRGKTGWDVTSMEHAHPSWDRPNGDFVCRAMNQLLFTVNRLPSIAIYLVSAPKQAFARIWVVLQHMLESLVSTVALSFMAIIAASVRTELSTAPAVRSPAFLTSAIMNGAHLCALLRRGCAALAAQRTLAGAFCILTFIGTAHGQLSLQGKPVGAIQDYWSFHPTRTGDDSYCTQTAATYADGTSAGTSTLNLNDGAGNRTISGKIICSENDSNTTPSNTALYQLTVLDMSNGANTTTVDLNNMASFGTTPGEQNSPTGWSGQGTLGHGTAYDWKNGPLFALGGYVCLPPVRQDKTPYYETGDSTFICSPDGGLYWLNPYSYYRYTVSNVACTTGTVTLTTSTNTLTGAGGDAIWTHGVNAGVNLKKYTTTSATGTTVVFSTGTGNCSGVTTGASSGYVAPMSATGDAPLNPSDASYTATRASMNWKDQSPWDGTTNLAGRIYVFDYCQANACTGMPHNADSYLYAFICTGRTTQCGLMRIPKDIDSLMDSSTFRYYSCANYSPANVCDGMSAGSWTATLANRTMLFAGTLVIANGTGQSINPTPNGFTNPMGELFGNPVYYTASGVGGYFQTTYNTTLGSGNGSFSGIMPFPSPWGPFVQVQSRFINDFAGFWNVMRYTQVNPDSIPGHTTFVSTGNNNAHSGSLTVYFQSFDVALNAGSSGMNLSGCTPYRFTWGGGVGSIIRKGLWGFFDFFSHGCWNNRASNVNQYFPSIYANDLSTYPPSKQAIGCVNDGGTQCGSQKTGVQQLMLWPDSVVVGNTGYQARFEVRDMVPGVYAAVTNTPFNSTYTSSGVLSGSAADPPWTSTIVLKQGDIATANQATIQTGTANHLLVMLTSFGGAGKIGIDWDSGGSFVVANTSSAVLVNGTWAYITFSKSPGAVTVCGTVPCSATVHIYLNGVEVPATRTNTGTPDMQTGVVSIGAGTSAYNGSTSFYAGWEIYHRVLTPEEIQSNYRAARLSLKNRGIVIP